MRWKRRVAREAQRILNSIKFSGFKTNLDDVLNKLKLKVYEYDPEDLKYDDELYKEFSNASGFLVPDKNAIFVNKMESPGRKRFTIAHEIGHYVLKHKESHILKRDELSSLGTNQQEKEANAFAAELLMPEEIFKFLYKDVGLTDRELAIEFGVSTHAIAVRKQTLRLK